MDPPRIVQAGRLIRFFEFRHQPRSPLPVHGGDELSGSFV